MQQSNRGGGKWAIIIARGGENDGHCETSGAMDSTMRGVAGGEATRVGVAGNLR